jgi:hypothetical protein
MFSISLLHSHYHHSTAMEILVGTARAQTHRIARSKQQHTCKLVLEGYGGTGTFGTDFLLRRRTRAATYFFFTVIDSLKERYDFHEIHDIKIPHITNYLLHESPMEHDVPDDIYWL